MAPREGGVKCSSPRSNLRTVSSFDSSTVSSFSSSSSIQSSNTSTQVKAVRFCDPLPSSSSKSSVVHRPQSNRVRRIFPPVPRSPKELKKKSVTRTPLDPPSSSPLPFRKTETSLRTILKNGSTSTQDETQTSVCSINNGGTIPTARLFPDSTSKTTIATITTSSLDDSSIAQVLVVDKLNEEQRGCRQQSIDFYSTRRHTENRIRKMVWKSIGMQNTAWCKTRVLRQLPTMILLIVTTTMTMIVLAVVWQLPSSTVVPPMEMENEELLHRLRVIEYETGC